MRRRCRLAYETAVASGSRLEESEKILLAAEHLHYICHYAKYVIRGRWPEAERIISDARNDSVVDEYLWLCRSERCDGMEDRILRMANDFKIIQYAAHHIKGRWPQGEQKILQSGNMEFVVHYAEVVLKTRWPEGEGLLLDVGDCTYVSRYAQHIIGGRWVEGERILLANGCVWTGIQYAADSLRCRWADLESRLLADFRPGLALEYARLVMKGRLPEELHNRMIFETAFNSTDPDLKSYFRFKRYQRVRKRPFPAVSTPAQP